MFRAALISMLLTSTALADTWTVDDDGKADFDNIQAAIDASSDGDEIVVMPGTYTGTGYEVVNMLGKAVWLHSSKGEQVTIIDGEDARRGIYCGNGETSNTIIEGFTITNGYSYVGGGMSTENNSNPTLENCTFSDNRAWGYGGGGMWNYNSSPTLTNCTFTGNIGFGCCGEYGGGMWNDNSSPTLTNCTFTNNTAQVGGGMANLDSSPKLKNCTFTNNIASRGGGMYSLGSPTLTNCTFENNTAYSGGGMYSLGSPTLTNCTFIANTAIGTMYPGYGGGGMVNAGQSTLINCTFIGNTSPCEHCIGGGVWNGGGGTMTNCIFTDNTAGSNGGGMGNSNSNATLTDTTVCGNTPDQIYGDWTDNGGNTIEDVCTTIGACCVDFSDGCYNVSELTCLAGSGTWLGPKTVCDDGECKSPICEADIDGNGSVDVGDLLAVIDAWGQVHSPADVNQDGIVDVSDLLMVVGNWGEC